MEMAPPNPTQPAPHSLPRSALPFVSAQAFGAGVFFCTETTAAAAQSEVLGD